MEKISFGDKVSEDLLSIDWWKVASPEDIVSIQLFVKEPLCPPEVLYGALTEVLGRPIREDDLSSNYDGICKEILGERSTPSEREIERKFGPIVVKIVVMGIELIFYSLALYPSFLILSLLVVFAAIVGNSSLLGCCTYLVRNYIEDCDNLKEKYKEGHKKLGYVMDSLEIAKNYNSLVWKVIL